MEELWLPVVGYEGYYIVSNMGRVASVPRTVKTRWGMEQRPGKMLSCYVDKTSCGYRCTGLSKECRVKKVSVHVLVLEAFVGPRPPGYDACHNDGDRTNCHLSNLRWDTRKANHADKIKHGTAQRGELASKVKLTEAQAREALESQETAGALAKRFGVGRSTIQAVRLGQNWKHLREAA